MKDYIDIPLKFTNPPEIGPEYEGLEPSVGYNVSPVKSGNMKFNGRSMLEPRIDLKQYVSRAVVPTA